MRERGLIAAYIMTNRRNGTLYTGVTSTLIGRVRQHCDGTFDGFTKRWGLKRLVWFELHETVVRAIRREKLIKHYSRQWKINLIEELNPRWEDLYPALVPDWEWKHDPPADA